MEAHGNVQFFMESSVKFFEEHESEVGRVLGRVRWIDGARKQEAARKVLDVSGHPADISAA